MSVFRTHHWQYIGGKWESKITHAHTYSKNPTLHVCMYTLIIFIVGEILDSLIVLEVLTGNAITC